MVALLSLRTWYNIRAASLAHGLRFDTTLTRQQGYDQVRQRLLDEGYLRKAFRRLNTAEREPLLALQAGGGRLPLHELTVVYGAIRPYKPWRLSEVATYQEREAARFPWKRPVSVIEKLWHLGIIEIQRGGTGKPDQALLPDEVALLLPPPPRPVIKAHPVIAIKEEPEFSRSSLTRDLAALLAGLLAGEGRWRRNRELDRHWLTPRSLHHLNRRLVIPDRLEGIRSERQSRRLRFLHYILRAAGLLNGGLPAAPMWTWLTQSESARQQSIWSAIRTDLKTRHPLWKQYELPPVSLRGWDRLTAVLESLQPDKIYERDSIYQMVRFTLDRATFGTLLQTVFTWGGWIQLQGKALRVNPLMIEQPAQLSLHHDTLYLDLPLHPPLRSLVEVAGWAEIETTSTLKVSPQALRRAVEQGYDAPQIIRALADLSGKPLAAEAVVLIRSGVQAARGLTLRPLMVLSAVDPETMNSIRSDWRLRPLLGEPLSPHHLVVQTDQVTTLAAKLARRGYPVTIPEISSQVEQTQIRDEANEYLYLAVSVYRQLSQITAPEIRLPSELQRSLQTALPAERVEALNQTAARTIDHLRHSLTLVDQTVARGGVAQDDPMGIHAAVETAYHERDCLTIQYYSPYNGEMTTRTIEPVMRYSRNGADYVDAWCRLDEAIRTFRLDRILRIIDESESAHRQSSELSDS